jgi:hypothetical protein
MSSSNLKPGKAPMSVFRCLQLREAEDYESLLSNRIDVDILQPNMNAQVALNYHHAHHQTLEDRAISMCVPV